MSKRLKLRSADSEIFELEEKIAVRSEVIKKMVEDGCADGVIPLPNVDSQTLSTIIEWCLKHGEEELGDEEVESWESKFMEVDMKTLFQMLTASNYLDIVDLRNACCRKAADLMKGKTPEEIRDIFGIENDFTPEEERAVKNKYAWAFN